MAAARIRILWGDELAGTLHRRSPRRWILEAAAFAFGAVLLVGLPLGLWTARHWQQQAREAQALADGARALEARLDRAERGCRRLQLLMADNDRLLARVTQHQAAPVAAEGTGAAKADARGPTPGAADLDEDVLWTRGQAQEAALTRLLDYWQHADRRLRHTPAVRPVPAAWLSSSFGIRHDPMSGALIMHKGLDLAGFTGMRVSAPADGVVIFVGTRGGYGQTVVVDHGWGLQTHFAHLSKFLVQRGQSLRRGEPLAEMGSTGKSTGPHLHYEVRLDGFPIDPRKFILD